MTLSLTSETTYWSLVHCLICLSSPMMSFFRKSISAIIDSFEKEIKEVDDCKVNVALLLLA